MENGKDNKEYLSQKGLADLVQESIDTNREILKSVNFIKKYYHWRFIWNIAKITIFVLLILAGALSIKSAKEYLNKYTSGYSSGLNQLHNIQTLIDKKTP